MRVLDKNGNIREAGVITSIGLTMPAEFSVAGSPLLANGTLAVSKANETANTVWAGPTSGAAAAPGFRALVGQDLGTRGTSTASAATLALPTNGSVIPITGTTSITTITALAAGTLVVLEFVSAGCKVVNGSNLVLDARIGDYVSAAGGTLTLECDGTNWHEVARAPAWRTSFVQATLSAPQSIPASTFTLVTLNTVAGDPLGELSTTTHLFTATYAGKYVASTTGLWNNLAANALGLVALYLNGTEIRRAENTQGNATNDMGNAGSWPVQLAAGDTLGLYALHTAALATSVYGGTFTRLDILRVG